MEATTLLLAEHGLPVEIVSLHQTSLTAGSDAEALTLVEYRLGRRTGWAGGRDRSVLEASVQAVLNAAVAANRSVD